MSMKRYTPSRQVASRVGPETSEDALARVLEGEARILVGGHTETAQRLRPWLDYAAAIPWTEPLRRPWEVSPEVAEEVVLKADRLLPGGSLMVNELAHAMMKSRSRFPRTRLVRIIHKI